MHFSIKSWSEEFKCWWLNGSQPHKKNSRMDPNLKVQCVRFPKLLTNVPANTLLSHPYCLSFMAQYTYTCIFCNYKDWYEKKSLFVASSCLSVFATLINDIISLLSVTLWALKMGVNGNCTCALTKIDRLVQRLVMKTMRPTSFPSPLHYIMFY